MMYKQVSAQFFEYDDSSMYKYVDQAMQYCLDTINNDGGTIVGTPHVESFYDSSSGRYGTVVIVYEVNSAFI